MSASSIVYEPKTVRVVKRNAEIVLYAVRNPTLSRAEIARHFQLSYALVTIILKQAGVTPPTPIKTKGPPSKELADRQSLMYDLYMSGNKITLEDIGELYGITRERARQIISRESGGNYRKSGSRIDPILVVKAARNSDNIWGCRRQLKASSPQVEECLRELGLWEAVQRLWRWRTSYKERQRFEEKRVFLIKELKRVAQELQYTPGVNDLRGGDRPWFSQYYRYFGSITEAQALAGLEPNAPGHAARDLKQ